jgi:riboflavin biosynthesis pyrimidine reductase
MALLRARADAVLVGDNTLNLEPAHVWTPDHVFDADAAAFAQLRQREDRRPTPLQVFLSLHGYIDFEAEVFKREDLHVVIATTTAGAASLASRPDVAAEVDILELGSAQVDPRGLISALAVEYNVRTLLCEGGPRAYGSLLAANCVDDEFLSLSPIVIGASQTAPRPSLVEGIAFSFHNHPTAKLLTVHRAENHLFLRSRYKHDEG